MEDQVILFCTDYFFHYLLIQSHQIRLCIAKHLSGLNLHSVEIISSERYPSHKDGKKYVLDITMRDNLGNFYNIEMQNGFISAAELARFQIYTMSMIDLQVQEGVQYKDMKKVHTLIVYTGNPVRNFEHLWHEVELMDGEYEKRMYNGLISMNFLQIRKMEEIEMEVLRSDFYQLMRLFENEERHKEEQTNEVAKEAVEMYERFISMKDYIYYREMQRERLWVESCMSEEREAGLAQGKSEETLRRACQIIFNKYKGEDLEWLKSCTQEQLDYAFDIVFEDIDYETFKKMICHYH